MKLNYLKIGQIKTLDELNKYSLNKPIFLGNYLFHYLIHTNNLKALRLYKFPINFVNNDGYNGFLLAPRYNNYKILEYFIKTYPEYIYSFSNENENFLHFCDPTNNNYLKLINKYKLNWNVLFQSYTTDGISNLDSLFLLGSYKTISLIIKKIKFKYNTYLKIPYTFSIILNKDLNTKNIISILKELVKQDYNIFKYNDNLGNNLLYPIVLSNNYKLLKYMYKQDIDFNSYTPINTFHIFKLAYNKGIISKEFKMADLIWDKIKYKHDFTETNKQGDNLVHYILKSRIQNNYGNYNLEQKVLKNFKEWDLINMDKTTPLDLIIQLDYKKYHKLIKNLNLKTKYNNTDIDNKWKKYIDQNIKINNNKNNIKLVNNNYSHGNIFQARFTDTAIFAKYLNDKYKSLYVPFTKNKIQINYKLYTNLSLPGEMLKNNLNFPWIIIWNNIDNYFVHPYLNKLIRENSKKYNYGFVYLSLTLPNNGLHASLILYDFINKKIERFDPYGNTMGLDTDMDNVLAKRLHINGFKYIEPSRYLPVAGFQTISDENNILNTKFGDFGGYCLAWCIWYIEHRLNNKGVDSKVLIRKTLNKFYTNKYKPMKFIRNYANKINDYRVKYLKKINIPDNIISNEMLPLEYLEQIKTNINKHF